MNEETLKRDDEFDVFLYVTGEMSAEQETQFESQLAHDQGLRERVAEMVCTLATVDSVLAAAKPNRRTWLQVISSLAALVLLGTLAVTLIPQPNVNEAESIAIAWAESVSEEFELPEQMEEFVFTAFDFESDQDWVFDVVTATQKGSY